jgi:hypothetical protein
VFCVDSHRPYLSASAIIEAHLFPSAAMILDTPPHFLDGIGCSVVEPQRASIVTARHSSLSMINN